MPKDTNEFSDPFCSRFVATVILKLVASKGDGVVARINCRLFSFLFLGPNVVSKNTAADGVLDNVQKRFTFTGC